MPVCMVTYCVQDPLQAVLVEFRMIYARGNHAETIYDIVLIKMLSQGRGYYVLHSFTEYTGERDNLQGLFYCLP